VEAGKAEPADHGDAVRTKERVRVVQESAGHVVEEVLPGLLLAGPPGRPDQMVRRAPAPFEIVARQFRQHIGEGESAQDAECLETRWGTRPGVPRDIVRDRFGVVQAALVLVSSPLQQIPQLGAHGGVHVGGHGTDQSGPGAVADRRQPQQRLPGPRPPRR
jgi:hypothetical protein